MRVRVSAVAWAWSARLPRDPSAESVASLATLAQAVSSAAGCRAVRVSPDRSEVNSSPSQQHSHEPPGTSVSQRMPSPAAMVPQTKPPKLTAMQPPKAPALRRLSSIVPEMTGHATRPPAQLPQSAQQSPPDPLSARDNNLSAAARLFGAGGGPASGDQAGC